MPFAIPEKWKWISASYVQTLVRGITFPASAKTKMQTHNSICCLTTGSVQEKYASKADVFVDQSFMKNTRQILQVGDVVISSANSKELVGKSILWEDKSGIQKTFGGFLTVARVKDSQSVIPEYLFLVYRYMFKTGYFANLSTQTTNIANLSNKLLDALAFPIPPLGEQQRLVAKLNKLLPLVETYGKEQEALEKLEKEFPDKLRASLLQEAIQGKLVPHRGRKRQRPHGPGHRSHGGHRRRYRVLYRVPAPCQQGRGHDGRRRPAAGQPGQLGTGR